jgi:molybdopterin-guanine dinucleotide biosynthesis protein A
MTSAVVLAGGASSRFGADKLAAPVGGRPLLHHALEAVAELADPIVLVLAPGAPVPPIPTRLVARVTVAHDAAAYRGPLAGLAAGLATLDDLDRGRDAGVLVVGGDMPGLRPAVLGLLADAVDRDPAIGAAVLEADPRSVLPLAIRPSLARPVVDARLRANRRALAGLLDELAIAVIPATAWRPLDPDGDTLRDVDTPADLGNARPG